MDKHDELKREIDREVEYLKGRRASIVIAGANDLSFYFADRISEHPGFMGIISENMEELPEKLSRFHMRYEDLIYIRRANPRIYQMADNGSNTINGYLREAGVDIKDLHRLGYGKLIQQNGSRMIDTYDPFLGKTRVDDDGKPELIIFMNEEKNRDDRDEGKIVKILILGGSCADPFYGNMKSWPEYLFEKLDAMEISCKVMACGMASYDSFQELKKLIRDGVLLEPDIVISYSGFNEGRYCDPDHPFSLKGDRSIAEYIVRKGIAVHDTGIGKQFPLNKISMGPEDERPHFYRWLTNERMMRGICEELGISFLAVLQPATEVWMKKLPLYRDAAVFFKEHDDQNWLFDLTGIFDEMQDIFIDGCHVYEEGNRRIAQTLLGEVLKLIKRLGE